MEKILRPLTDIVSDIRLHYNASGLTQSAYSRASGVNQSTLSRLLSPKLKTMRLSQGVTKICDYAKIDVFTRKLVSPKDSKELMDALQYTWDGSEQHSKALARIIMELGNLTRT